MVVFDPKIGIDPLHRAAFINNRPLGYQVVNVIRPVLDGGVSHASVLLDKDFDHARVEAIGGVGRRRASLNIMNLRTFIGDNNAALELADIGNIQAEVSLQRQFHFDTLGDVNKRATRPDRTVQGGKFVIFDGDGLAKIFTEQIGVLAQTFFNGEEDHALLFEVL